MINYPLGAKSVILAGAITIVFLASWEMHWRSEGYPIAPDDDKALWAEQRAKLENTDATGVALLGSSRVFFDIQLNEWQKETGVRPVMIAAAGTTPLPVFQDIVENSEFNGTLLIGITPPLYFSPPVKENDFFQRITNWIKHYHKRTYADRLNHFLSKGPQNSLAFLNSTEETFYNELDLKTLIDHIPLPKRVMAPPPFPEFQYLDKDRNVTMWEITVTDTTYARMITNFWSFVIQPPPHLPPPEVIEEMKNGLIGLTVSLVEKFEARGGKVIFIRCPSQNQFRMAENGGFPREVYWDKLVKATNCASYHFEDYAFMSKYTLPEWSHLATPDARQFTKDLVQQMQKDGVL